MSSDAANVFTKDNLDGYLKDLAKEYRKRNGKAMPAEIVLIGGAAVLVNYGFRDMTTDVDALIQAASSMKDAINTVGDRFGLPNGWLNDDFVRTDSYSPRLSQYSVYYRTYSNVLQIRTISAEYLIAMKLCSGRKYKNDLSDVVGILAEHEKTGDPISWERIDSAVMALYGSWGVIANEIQVYIRDVLEHTGELEQMYSRIVDEERAAKDTLLEFEQDYPGVANTENVNSILNTLKAKKESRAAVLDRLKKTEK